MEPEAQPPGPNCSFLGNGPTGPRKYEAEKPEACYVTITCQNASDLRDVITVDCRGTKKCKPWTEPWADTFYCPPNAHCVGGGKTVKVPIADRTGKECGPCVPWGNAGCGCPNGYNKI